MFKRNYSKKRMNKIVMSLMIIGIIVISGLTVVAVNESKVKFLDLTEEENNICLKSLDCDTDQDCYDKSIRICGGVSEEEHLPYHIAEELGFLKINNEVL